MDIVESEDCMRRAVSYEAAKILAGVWWGTFCRLLSALEHYHRNNTCWLSSIYRYSLYIYPFALHPFLEAEWYGDLTSILADGEKRCENMAVRYSDARNDERVVYIVIGTKNDSTGPAKSTEFIRVAVRSTRA